MPHTRTAKKRLRQNDKRRIHSRAIKRAVKTFIKRFDSMLKEGNMEQAAKEHHLAVKKLDQAASKGVFHKNMAARKKAQLDKKLQQAQAKPAES